MKVREEFPHHGEVFHHPVLDSEVIAERRVRVVGQRGVVRLFCSRTMKLTTVHGEGNDVPRIHLSNGGLPIPGRSLPSTSTARRRALMALRARRKLNDGRQHCFLFVQLRVDLRRKLTN